MLYNYLWNNICEALFDKYMWIQCICCVLCMDYIYFPFVYVSIYTNSKGHVKIYKAFLDYFSIFVMKTH
jgi:hypothetical protein